ncbi:hypothetical protein ACFLY2_01855 [Patescibacteria group bacterium]
MSNTCNKPEDSSMPHKCNEPDCIEDAMEDSSLCEMHDEINNYPAEGKPSDYHCDKDFAKTMLD